MRKNHSKIVCIKLVYLPYFSRMFFCVESCLSKIRKTVKSSSQGSKSQAVQMLLTLRIKTRLSFEISFTNYATTERNILEEFRRTESSTTSLRDFNLYIKLPHPITFCVYNYVTKNPPFGHKFDNLKPVHVSLTLFL